MCILFPSEDRSNVVVLFPTMVMMVLVILVILWGIMMEE